eukprot:9385316-Alexandrium_andersonii.AAC.1
MSASLVGSEMCIRDRPMPEPDLHHLSQHARTLETGIQAQSPHRGRGPSPVSYTHLTLPTICSV